MLFAPSGFMKVDADDTAKPFEPWRAEGWSRAYEGPTFPNHFAVGIAFALTHRSPPHS